MDVRIGEEKQKEIEKFNELKYIQEYIKFYYEKTNQQLKTNRILLVIMIILLFANLTPNIIKLIIFISLM